MPTQIVRLHRRPDDRTPAERAAGVADTSLQVLEQTQAELERAARIGGRVWDVTVEVGGPKSLREVAGELLALALGPYDPLANNAGLVARARRDVSEVPLHKPTPGPTSRKAGRRKEA